MIKKIFCSAIAIACVALSSNLSFNFNAIRKVSALSNAVLSDCVITDISAGTDHNLALDQNGNLWAWGRNDHGQIGDGTTTNCLKPKRIFSGHKFSKISAGNNCSAAIDVDGYLYGWGSSINPTKSECLVPTIVDSANTFSDVLCSFDSTQVAPITSTDVYFGYAYYDYYHGTSRGGTEVSNTSNNGYDCHPKITGKKTFRAFSNGTSYSSMGVKNYEIPNNIIAIDGVYFDYYNENLYDYSAYYDYTFVIDSEGKLLTYSRGVKGYLNNNNGYNTVHQFFPSDMSFESLNDEVLIDVSVRKVMSSSSTCNNTVYLVSERGNIYSLGDNTHGELGNADYISSTFVSNPVEVDSNAIFTSVSAGGNHVLALDNYGKVYTWGSNMYGQLGHGDNVQRDVPQKVQTLDEEKCFDFIAYSGDITTGSFQQFGGLSYSIEKQATKGILTVDENGDFTYKINSDAHGNDSAIISIAYSGITKQYGINIKIDRKPVFIGGVPSFNVECGQSFNGTAPAIDPDGDGLVYSIYQEPSKGTVKLNNNSGSYTYTAMSDMAGGDTFIIAVSDGYCTVQYPVSVHVQSLITYSDDTQIDLDLLNSNSYTGNVNAIDIDGDTLTYSIKNNGSKGKATIDSLGNYTYVANGTSFGQDSFIVNVDDGYKPLEITYYVNIYSVSDAGTTLAAKITKGTIYNGEIKTSANGATPEYSVHSQPLNGNVAINRETGNYTYTPNLGSSGDDSFVVLVDYGFGQYTITIHVYQNTIPNNALVSTEITTAENTNYSGTAQCTDVDGDALIYTIKTQPQKGSLSLNPTTGEYIYYPNSNVAGDDLFEINVNDGTDAITNSISIHIESDIVVDSEINKTISQNTSLSSKVIASDKDGDTITYSITKNADNGIANVDSLTGDYIYIPNTNYYGSDSIKITVSDGVSPKVVTIHVNVNRRPIANNISINLETDGITVTGTSACSDPDGDVLTYYLVAQPSQGNVIVNSSNGGFAYTPNADAHGNDSFQIRATDGCDDILVTISIHNETQVELQEQEATIVVNQGKSTTGKVLAIDLDGDELAYSLISYPTQGTVNLNSSTGAWTYNAKSTAKGRDSFKVQVTDDNSSATIEYGLIINTPASFEENSYSFDTNQNNNYTGSVFATDADGDSLTYSVVSQGSKGTVTVDPLTGRYQYAPVQGEAGNDLFIVGVSDGNFTSEVIVNVHIESDITIANGTLTVNVEQNDIVTGNVNAYDVDEDTLTYSISKQGEKGNANVMGDGSFSYYANSGAGDDSFIVSITDGLHTSYVTVYVHVSTNPYFEESSVTIFVPQSGNTEGQVHGVDQDGDTLSYSIFEQPAHGTVNLNSTNGKYTYTAFNNSTASSDSFKIAVTDGNTISYATVNVVINNAPNISESCLTISQGGSGSGTIDATDPENDVLTYRISSQGSHGSTYVNSSTGEYTYTITDTSFSGTDYFAVSVTDGYSVKTIVVSVEVVKNQKPTSTGISINVNSGSSTEGQLNVTDPENDSLIYSISSQGDKGTAYIDEQTGKFTYSAKPDTTGYDCFVVTVSDGYNTVSYLVEVSITFVDSNNSWAIPTTIVTGTAAVLSLGGLLAFTLINGKKKKVNR